MSLFHRRYSKATPPPTPALTLFFEAQRHADGTYNEGLKESDGTSGDRVIGGTAVGTFPANMTADIGDTITIPSLSGVSATGWNYVPIGFIIENVSLNNRQGTLNNELGATVYTKTLAESISWNETSIYLDYDYSKLRLHTIYKPGDSLTITPSMVASGQPYVPDNHIRFIVVWREF